MSPRHTKSRRGSAMLLAMGLLAATIGSFGFVLSRLWDLTDQGARSAASERAGVAYLRPLNHVLAELVEARSATLGTGHALDGVRGALDETAAAEARWGAELGTAERWRHLRERSDSLLAGPNTGRGAYQRFDELITLTAGLMDFVGDNSKLILDPELGSVYLVDIALTELPAVLLGSAQITDEAVQAARAKDDAQQLAVIRISTARHVVATAADAVGENLGKVTNSGAGPEVSDALLTALDPFRTAIDAVTPPAALRPTAADLDAPELRNAAGLVTAAFRPLADAVLVALDKLLATRIEGLGDERQSAGAAAAAGIAVGAALLWWAVPAASRRGVRHDVRPGRELPDIARVAGDLPQIGAQQLLAAEELHHVGRAVRAYDQGRDDHAR
ncbi:hypothetical protein [Catellatospora citrea]|uniref:Uncharacterized protein n=1 Tax=Catellatospora citrea TaxID=53366 RepID=A0A8J3KTX5_9ACTN|nr:hypothetical protein [Catellatospora citrea]RKE10681.1 hypothetical protein C8E86_5597 [Catellatospora citrea]GIG01185.1 hypothetical protein Cci01nite_62780 [Catellatospora citrea]